ncbi:hypothetical protein Trydic_g5331 [Trypoxylus dichotomus]
MPGSRGFSRRNPYSICLSTPLGFLRLTEISTPSASRCKGYGLPVANSDYPHEGSDVIRCCCDLRGAGIVALALVLLRCLDEVSHLLNIQDTLFCRFIRPQFWRGDLLLLLLMSPRERNRLRFPLTPQVIKNSLLLVRCVYESPAAVLECREVATYVVSSV